MPYDATRLTDCGVHPDQARTERAIETRLSGVSSVSELLARACVDACAECGFDRSLVLSEEDGFLVPTGMAPTWHSPSDELRSAVLTDPIPLRQGCLEAELIRRPGRRTTSGSQSPSVTQEALALEQSAIAPVVVDGRAVALLVLDRASPLLDETGQAAVDLYARVLECTLQRLVLQLRMRELALVLQHLTVSANAVIREAAESPLMLPGEVGGVTAFPVDEDARIGAQGLADPLTERERDVARLMVTGRSNREIASELYLSPETVKGHVARLLRRLRASNRVEAVALLVRSGMVSDGHERGSHGV